jgi:hypothetical protein
VLTILPHHALALVTPLRFFAPYLLSTEYFETENAPEPGLEYNLAGAYGQDQAAEKKQESLFAGPIAIYLDGILCHAASVITLLFKMAQ